MSEHTVSADQIHDLGTDLRFYDTDLHEPGILGSLFVYFLWEHVFVYDENGKLIYDLSSQRVKGFIINTNPDGKEFFQSYKLSPADEIPDGIKEIFGW